MANILITAFKGYQQWEQNASWLALVEFTKELPPQHEITTRLYPVDYAEVQRRLQEDLSANYDFALHLGQAPGSSHIQLECIGVNVATGCGEENGEAVALAPLGPVAYRSHLPLDDWARRLRECGIPAEVSFHAGTYLCNATLYLTHHLICGLGLKTQAAFIHLPLDVSQVTKTRSRAPSLPAAVSAQALSILLDELAPASPRV